MQRISVPIAGAALLQLFAPQPALAQSDVDRYVASDYAYCDAVMLGAFWGESVEAAKATIGRKLGWGNADIVAGNLDEARAQGQRCDFVDTGFDYDDADALADLWSVSVEDAKAALAEKVSTGYRTLADQVVQEAHAQRQADGD